MQTRFQVVFDRGTEDACHLFVGRLSAEDTLRGEAGYIREVAIIPLEEFEKMQEVCKAKSKRVGL